MGAVEEWRKRMELRKKHEALASLFTLIAQRIENGQLDDAAELAEESFGAVDELGDTFTLTQWPVCLGCYPTPGTAELPPAINSSHASLCQDDPDRCPGNRYGRMHPSQLLDFIHGKVAARHGAAAQREEERAASQRAPVSSEEIPPMEMAPTLPPALPTAQPEGD